MRLLCRAGTCRRCALSLKSLCSARQREDRESSVSCVLSACWACPREGSVQFQESVYLSHSLILLNLLTSSRSSVTKRRSSSTWTHLPQVCSPLPSSTGVRAGHSLQPDTWVAACSPRSSAWAAASVVVGAELSEAMAFCWVDTTAPWSSWQGFSALPARSSTQTAAQRATPCPCCRESCGLLAALSAPPEVPPVRETSLCTTLGRSAADRAGTLAAYLSD